MKNAAEENDIPIGFLARLLWQESRFRAEEISSAGARGIAQFMPQTAVEMGLKNPFDPLQAIPASAKFLRKLYDQFGNLGLAAAAYNAGGGRIEKWLSRRNTLPKETRDYVKIITGHQAEAWTDAENTVHMPTDLPDKAPCEGVGGLSTKDQIAEVPVDLTPSASAMVRKAEADDVEEKKNDGSQKTACRCQSGGCTYRRRVPEDECPGDRASGKGFEAEAWEKTRRASRVIFCCRQPDKVIESATRIVGTQRKKPALLRAFLSLPAAVSAAAEAEGYAGSAAVIAGSAVVTVRARSVIAVAVVVRPV